MVRGSDRTFSEYHLREGRPNKFLLGSHGCFPLQKPRMLVRCARTCFREETGWLRFDPVPIFIGAGFFVSKTVPFFDTKKSAPEIHAQPAVCKSKNLQGRAML